MTDAPRAGGAALLSDEELAEMRDRHPQGEDAYCVDCDAGGSQCVARLLAHMDAALRAAREPDPAALIAAAVAWRRSLPRVVPGNRRLISAVDAWLAENGGERV